jgi:beta-1,4-mannosyl-glycoprotein beta-1,4-N-acetylglucosaminyltransferase
MIYDGFIFFNELDVLNIRLNELDCEVDQFILVESTHTFTNIPKPFINCLVMKYTIKVEYWY